MKFTKMHGLGNDYVVVDGLRGAVRRPAQLARVLCRRRFGVGADGLLVVLASRRADFRMRMYNPDGTEAEMCGNGLRCFGRFVFEQGMVRRRGFCVETKAGIHRVELSGRGKAVTRVRAEMGKPILERQDIPMRGRGSSVIGEVIRAGRRTFRATCLSMGNPHCVVFVDDVAAYPVAEDGPILENHGVFPRRTNVEFVQVVSASEVRQRTWERGAGETLACGSGAAAVLVACVLNGRTGRRIRCRLDGGDLRVEWAEDGIVYQTGPAETVFSGESCGV